MDNCAGKLIRSNHRLMATYVQLMPRMVQRRMEEMESKAAENAKLEAAAAAATVGPDSQNTPVETPVTATEATQNLPEVNTHEVGLLEAMPLTPPTENILDSGTSISSSLSGLQNIEPAPYTPPKSTLLPEDVPVSTTSVQQKSTEQRVGPE